MRSWRPINGEILLFEPGRLSKVSAAAKWLFMCLLLAQDDDGTVPNTVWIAEVVQPSTGWTGAEIMAHLMQLDKAGLIRHETGGRLRLYRASEFNGADKGECGGQMAPTHEEYVQFKKERSRQRCNQGHE